MCRLTNIETQLKDSLVQTTNEFDHRVRDDAAQLLSEASLVISSIRQGRRTMRRFGLVAVAAAILVALANAVIWMNADHANAAFAEVQEKVSEVSVVKYTFRAPAPADMTIEVVADERGSFRMDATYRDGTRMQAVYSADRKEVLVLQPGVKQARVIQVESDALKMFKDLGAFLSKFRNLESDAVQRLADQSIEGRKVVGFRVLQSDPISSPPLTHWTVWADAKTRLPVRIECASSWEEAPRGIMNHFVFGAKIDKTTFDTTPPAGWQVQRERISAPPERR